MKDKINKEELEQELLDFVEGRMDFDTFWQNFLSKKYEPCLKIKIGYIKRFSFLDDGSFSDNLAFFIKNTKVFYAKSRICDVISYYLEYRQIPFKITTKYSDEMKLMAAIQPSYIDVEDTDFLNSIIQQAPEGLKKVEKKKWLKEKIKSMFKYDIKPPRWIQFPEWPIVNGKPLVFKSQTRLLKNDERVFYTFYDPDTLEETVIMQFF